MSFIGVVKNAMPSLRQACHESCHSKNLLRKQTLRFLFRSLHAQVDPKLATATNIIVEFYSQTFRARHAHCPESAKCYNVFNIQL